MLALRLLVTATLTAWAVTTYTPEITNKLSKQHQWKRKNTDMYCIIQHHFKVRMCTTLSDCDFFL